MSKIRTRFAPSPTGSLHIGGLRTALFNYMFAKKHGGDFILRIEDTDQKRYDSNALQVLIESLQWAGLNWDEFYVQSERLELYQNYAHQLVADGKAYYCTCSSERLQQVNAKKMAEGHNPGYDRHCRHRHLERHDVEGKNYVVRLIMPMYDYTVYDDAVRGTTKFKNNLYNDAVLLKADGFPTYHLAHVVDDYHMEVTHVIRAVEWQPSTPTHLQLWQAFGWEPPIYAHLPVLLNPTGKGKISKRNPPKDSKGNVVPVLVHDYINAGYLPEAVLNFLCNTGWNYGRNEYGDEVDIFDLDSAIQRFDLKDVNPASSRFPVAKLDWINGVYIREMGAEKFASMLFEHIVRAGIDLDPVDDTENFDLVVAIAPLIQPRCKTLSEAVELARPFFEEPDVVLQRSDYIMGVDGIRYELMNFSYDNEWTTNNLRSIFEQIAEFNNVKLNDVCAPVRYALTGKTVSVPLFEMMEILGRETCLERLEKVLGQ